MTSAERIALASSANGASVESRAGAGEAIRALGSRVTPYRVVLGGLLVLVLAFYMWTAASTIPFTFPTHSNDVYNELTSGFLQGHVYLPITPPASLLHLRDPYDPALNAPYQAAYHDFALYGGHFYSSWGPTPVLTLFAPFRLLTGRVVPESFAVALFCFIGLACAVALLHLLVARWVPRTPRWVLLTSTACLALCNAAPFLLRRPIEYEVAISCGYCFEMAGLLLVAASLREQRVSRGLIAAGSLCLGLAVGGRPTLIFGAVVAPATALWAIRRRGERPSLMAYALAPVAVCGLLLALYNRARFGSPTDFGARWVLAGIDQTKLTLSSLKWLLPGLFNYLLIPARFAITFPHAFLMTSTSDPFTLPVGYAGTTFGAEPTGGVLPTMPITLFLLALPVLWHRHSKAERAPLLAATGLTALGLCVVAGLSYGLFSTTERYEVDFATLLLLPALLLWVILLARFSARTTARRFVATLGAVCVFLGAAQGVAFGLTGYYDLLRIEHPALFNSLEDLTSPLATLATMIGGNAVIARVDPGPVAVSSPHQNYFSFTEGGSSAYLGTYPITLTIIAPGSRRMDVTAGLLAGVGAPALSKLAVDVSSAGRKVTVPITSQTISLPCCCTGG